MQEINFWAIIISAFAAFVGSTIWYIAFGKQLATVSPAFAEALKQKKQPPWKPLAVFVEHIVIALVLSYVIGRMGITSWLDAAWLGFLLWLGMSAMQWVSSMIWEKASLKLAAIHAGDWLMKLVLIAAIVGAWR